MLLISWVNFWEEFLEGNFFSRVIFQKPGSKTDTAGNVARWNCSFPIVNEDCESIISIFSPKTKERESKLCSWQLARTTSSVFKSWFTDPGAPEWREGQAPRMNPGTAPKIHTVSLPPSLSQRDLRPFTRVTVHWGKGNHQTFRDSAQWPWTDTSSRKPKCHCGHQSEWGLGGPYDKWGFSSGPSSGVPSGFWGHMCYAPCCKAKNSSSWAAGEASCCLRDMWRAGHFWRDRWVVSCFGHEG